MKASLVQQAHQPWHNRRPVSLSSKHQTGTFSYSKYAWLFIQKYF